MGDRRKRKRSPSVPEQEQVGSDAAAAPGDASQSRLRLPAADLKPRLGVDATSWPREQHIADTFDHRF